MKKIFFCIFTVICILLSVSPISAEGLETIIDDNIVTVEFSDDSVLSVESRDKIANDVLIFHLTNEVPTSNATRGVLCSLFGHDTTTQILYVTEHKVLSYNPRCAQHIYEVTTCSRCDYELIEFLFTEYIECCPED